MRLMADIFKQLLIQKYRNTHKGFRKQKRLKSLMSVYPFAIERQYAKDIKAVIFQSLIDHIWRLITQENYERWVKDYKKVDSVEYKQDAYEDEVNRIIGTLELEEDNIIEGNAFKEMTQKAVIGTYLHTKGDWQRQTQAVVGVPYSTDESWWPKTRQAWQNENKTFLKSYPSDFIKKASNTVYTGVREGKLWGDVKKELETLGKGTNFNSERLARDQIGKLNGQLQHYRQTEIGIDKYNWMTVGDERVRGNPGGKYPDAIPSHWLMEGFLCKWDDPTVYSQDEGKTWIPRPEDAPMTHPGFEIQCRCQALAYMDDLLDSAQEEVENEEGLSVSPEEETPSFQFQEKPLELNTALEYENFVAPVVKAVSMLSNTPENLAMLNATSNYQSYGHKMINKVLRTGEEATPGEKKDIKEISKFIDKYPMRQSVKMYRGFVLKTPLDLEIGDTYLDKGFTSWSANREHGINFSKTWGTSADKRYLIEYTTKAGDKVAPLVYNENWTEFNRGKGVKEIKPITAYEGVQEQEFLGQKGLKLKVLNKYEKNGIIHLEVENEKIENLKQEIKIKKTEELSPKRKAFIEEIKREKQALIEKVDQKPLELLEKSVMKHLNNAFLSEEDSLSIKAFIKKAPKYNGELFRGMGLSSDEVLKPGENYTPIGLSWSKSREIAEQFINRSEEDIKTVFHIEKSTKGVDVSHLAHWKEEKEVMVIPDKYKVISIQNMLTGKGINYKLVNLREIYE